MSLTVLFIVESRSGLIKVAAIYEAFGKSNLLSTDRSIRRILLDMRQAIAGNSSAIFFNDIELPVPDIFLSAPVGMTFPESTTLVHERFSEILATATPDVVMITGSSDYAVACALAVKRSGLAPLRAGERRAPALALVEPEWAVPTLSDSRQLNTRFLARLADYIFVSEAAIADALLSSTTVRQRVYVVGSLAADSVLRYRELAMGSSIVADLQLDGPSRAKPFALLALRQPLRFRLATELQRLQPSLSEITRQMPVVCPADDALVGCIRLAGLEDYFVDHFVNRVEGRDGRVRIRLTPLLGYLDFIKLLASARLVLTDCEDVQLQASVLGTPCIDVAQGIDVAEMRDWTESIRHRRLASRASRSHPGWRQGRAAERILEILQRDYRVPPVATLLSEPITPSRFG